MNREIVFLIKVCTVFVISNLIADVLFVISNLLLVCY